MARVIQVIEVAAHRGAGTDDDPLRTVLEYWSVEGVLLAERDQLEERAK